MIRLTTQLHDLIGRSALTLSQYDFEDDPVMTELWAQLSGACIAFRIDLTRLEPFGGDDLPFLADVKAQAARDGLTVVVEPIRKEADRG